MIDDSGKIKKIELDSFKIELILGGGKHMIYDTTKKGLETVFLDYQIAVWRYLWRTPKPSVFSLDTWEAVKRDIAPKTVSRASIINFLNKMVAEGLLDHNEVSGKGGMKGEYSLNGFSNSEAELKHTLSMRLMESIKAELGE